ncbi:MAG: hypothetical protein Q9168_005824, partial [Polycauliona sp. 1 TL-2023]
MNGCTPTQIDTIFHLLPSALNHAGTLTGHGNPSLATANHANLSPGIWRFQSATKTTTCLILEHILNAHGIYGSAIPASVEDYSVVYVALLSENRVEEMEWDMVGLVTKNTVWGVFGEREMAE